MDIKKQDAENKLIMFFDEINSKSVETAIKDVLKIGLKDCQTMKEMELLGFETANYKPEPISFNLCTPGGSCYYGMALYDTIRTSQTPVEIICQGMVMSMGVIVTLSANVRKAHANTIFMIHQVSGLLFGYLQDMEEKAEEIKRINEMLFKIITERTAITNEQLDDIVSHKREWYITAQEALTLGIITEII